MALNPINLEIYKRLPTRFTVKEVKKISRELQPHVSKHQLCKEASNFCNNLRIQKHVIAEKEGYYNIYEKLTPANKLKTRIRANDKTLLKELPSKFTRADVFNLLKESGISDNRLWNSTITEKIYKWKKDGQIRNTGKKEKVITPLGERGVSIYEKISEKNPLPPQKQPKTPTPQTDIASDDLRSYSIEYKKKMADILRGIDTDKNENPHETTQESEYQEFEYTLELGDCDSTVVNNGTIYLGNLKISGTFTITPLKK